MGAATTLGSEPMVGLQWVRRMRARGPVSVLCSAVFRDSRFLPPEEWRDFVFVDTTAASTEDYATNFATHLWRWWRGVRAHLKAHAEPHDRLLIAAPAAIWMLPWVGGLPIPRDRIFFGPMGVVWVPREILGKAWPGVRNVRTAVAIALWRLLAPWLPRDLALRQPVRGFSKLIGPRFRLLGTLPEVELPPMKVVSAAAGPTCVAVIYDRRPVKRFRKTLTFALRLARDRCLPLSVIGAPPEVVADVSALSSDANVCFRPVARMDRACFQAWLVENAPEFVALSSSEGVPSALIEALLAGCRVHVHEVGGIHWLARVGCERASTSHEGASVVSFRWDAESLARYERDTRVRFVRLLDALDAATEALPAP